MTESNVNSAWFKSGKQIIELGERNVPTLVDPIIPKYGAISLAGSSDLGKSYLLLQLSVAIITGATEFLGFPLNATHKSVIYLSTEDDEFSLCPRLLNMLREGEDLDVYENLRVLFETTDLVNRLDVLLTDKPADVVIIDTFSDIFDGDMNQANKVRGFIQKFKEIGHRHGALIILNHHCSKRNDDRIPHKDNLLGSQGFESSMRMVIELRKDFTRSNIRHLCIVKGNYLNEDFKGSSFELDFNYEQGFVNTGERINFARLIKTDGEGQAARTKLKERILALEAENKSYSQIVNQLKEEGIKISKSTVGNISKENRATIQIPIENKTDGQEAA